MKTHSLVNLQNPSLLVLYECDRDADLMALWGCVRGWGKRNEPRRREGR